MKIQPVAGLTRGLRAAQLVLIGVMTVTLVRALLFFLHYVAVMRGSHALEFVHPISGAMRAVLRLETPATLVVFILFLVWLARVNRNLRDLSGEELTFTPGWVAGWFFVPFANFVMPYRVVREIWLVSRRREADRSTELVAWWWGLTLAGYASSIAMTVAGLDLRGERLFLYLTLALALHAINLTNGVVRLSLIGRVFAGYSRSIVEPAVVPLAGSGAVGLAGAAPAGWYPDPCGRHEHRFWDGACWSPAVADQGAQSSDPV
jgi:hypothetical protein